MLLNADIERDQQNLAIVAILFQLSALNASVFFGYIDSSVPRDKRGDFFTLF